MASIGIKKLKRIMDNTRDTDMESLDLNTYRFIRIGIPIIEKILKRLEYLEAAVNSDLEIEMNSLNTRIKKLDGKIAHANKILMKV